MSEDTDARARATAHGLIQGYIGPDHKVIDMKAFYSALVQALKEARQSRVFLGVILLPHNLGARSQFARLCLRGSNRGRFPMTRRFPAPWQVEQIAGGFKVLDASDRALAYVYARETKAAADIDKALTFDGVLRIAVNFARLPELLGVAKSAPFNHDKFGPILPTQHGAPRRSHTPVLHRVERGYRFPDTPHLLHQVVS